MEALIFWLLFVGLIVGLSVAIRMRRNRMRTLAYDVRDTTSLALQRDLPIQALKDQAAHNVWGE